ncbi:MAG: hypothetical protein WBP12_05265 [Candidatus Saccharimonas sp.]
MTTPEQPVFYIDLDRTLFRTESANEIFAMVEYLYPENYRARGGYTKRAEHYVYPRVSEGDTTTYYHDVSQWLRDVGIDAKEAFERMVVSVIADGRFEYPGVEELVRSLQTYGEVKLLTYGEGMYQRFKARLCPSLHGIEVITTVQPKAEFLNRYAREGDWMIDDKEIVGLKPRIETVRIVHDKTVAGVCASLQEVEAVVVGRLQDRVA